MSSERWQQMNEIFQRALESPPEARDALLRASCGPDESLRRAVEKLLRANQDAGTFLEEPLVVTPSPGTRERDDSGPADSLAEPPAEDGSARVDVGPYRLLRQLGEGGMGTVFLASREDGAFRRHVAVKLLRQGKESADTLQRMQAERQILAGLEHPYVARLYDGDATDEGLPYFVMEYVEGEPIDLYCDRHRLTVGERIRLFRKVCEAVDYAHRHLVVHRDLKPSNILVTAEGVPKLLDFGIAKIVDPQSMAADGDETTFWMRPLTLHYASPEQVLGRPITTASDVYSLGVLLYRLLSGRLPHRFEGRAILEIEGILAEEPLKPSLAVATADGVSDSSDAAEVAAARSTTVPQLERRLRGDLDHVLQKALRSDPEDRYRSVRHLAEDLERSESGFPVSARRGEAWYRLKKFVRRNWGRLAVAAIFGLLVFGFAVDRSLQSARLGRALVQAEDERDEKERVIELVAEIFRAADPTRSRGEQLTVREALDQVDVLERWPISEGGEATLRETVGSIYFQLDLVEKAREQLERVVEIRRRLYGEESLEVARSLSALGSALFELGEDDDEALAMLRDAIRRARRIVGHESPELVDLLNRLVRPLCFLGDYGAAQEPSIEALELARRHRAEIDPVVVAEALINRATILKNHQAIERGSRVLEDARRLFGEALVLLQERRGEVHPDVAAILNNLGDLAFQLGDFEDAGRLHRQALDVRRQLFPDGHLSVAQSLNHLGKTAMEVGDHASAEGHFRDALGLVVELRGAEHYVTTRPALGLASVLILQQRFAEAEDLLLRSLEIRERAGRGKAEVVEQLGELYQVWGRPGRASEYRGQAARDRTARPAPGG